jgi:hypothetical protein
MRIVVPLAGPDFVGPDGTVKALHPVDGLPLLRRALESRPWADAVPPGDMGFVMMDRPETRAFAEGPLQGWYPGASVVFLSRPTGGAALSALAGMALAAGAQTGPIIVDLADILYSATLDVAATLSDQPRAGGIALTFESDWPGYSYLRCDADGRVVEAAEKRVISSHASAGTYVFASAAVYLRAVAHALENANSQTHNGLFFVCPLFNGVLAQGLDVALAPVSDVIDIKQGDAT